MTDYTLTFARSARKELERLQPQLTGRILLKIEALTQTPRPPGSIKLQGEDNLWRIRIGDYRVIYAINDSSKVVDISVIRHRRDVYRDF